MLNHPDLDDNLNEQLAPGFDFIREPAIALDGNGIDGNPDDPGDRFPGGSSFHGTHVAGTIAAESDNLLGVAGVAWKTDTLIMPLRALGKGGGTLYDVMQAVRYAAGLENDSRKIPPARADVINLSLGGGGFSQAAQDVFTEARSNRGVVIIAAAGNQNIGTPFYPAAYEGVVSVSAVDLAGNPTWYSNFGSTIDAAAPGGDLSADLDFDGSPDGVLSTCGDDRFAPPIQYTYCFFQGTSMAAPHMAGVVALMKSVHPGLSPEDLEILLVSGAITEDLGGAGRDDRFGYGLIDAFNAYGEAERLAGGGELPAAIIATPGALDFGITRAAREFTLQNGGGSSTTLDVTGVIPNRNWLVVAPTANVGIGGLGTYRVTIDDSALTDGEYAAAIVITSTANTVSLPVRMQKGISAAAGGNAGFHYVLLVDADTQEVVDINAVDFNGAAYTFVFENIMPGSYRIFAGTDSDNDFLIGDPGEAFGAYPSADLPGVIRVNEDHLGLDFSTGFDVVIPSRLSTGGTTGRPVLQRRPR